jgi:two-component system, NarL family, nitrate/nitrite response regulator NarL
MESAMPIRLVFVDDHPTLLAGLATIFASDDRFEIVGTGTTADEALGLARSKLPDVMILDLSMPGEVFGAIEEISRQIPTLKLVVFTAFANVDLALKALDAGAHAFVLKGRPADDLYEAIQAVRRGDLFVSPEFSQRVVAGFRNRARRETTAVVKLSAREQQLVNCLLEGQTNKEIARTLELTEKTVKHYMTNLMTKLQVKNRLEVVLAARKLNASREFDFNAP